ncbi:MAG: hypothetical protein ABI399_04460 [Bauldia sp.]
MTTAEIRSTGNRLGGWLRPIGIGLLAIVVVVAGGVAVWRLVRHYHDSVALSGRSADTTPVSVTIAGNALAIPANMIRTGRQRRGGAAERVDLLLDWPDLNGYSAEDAEPFRNGSPIAPLIYVSIVAADSALDSTGRLEPVYSRFFTGDPVRGPSGLTGRLLSEDSGYRGEQIFYQPGVKQPFVARCIATATPEVPATCLRDVQIAPRLSMLYRFDRFYLGDWQEMEGKLRDLALRLLAPR